MVKLANARPAALVQIPLYAGPQEEDVQTPTHREELEVEIAFINETRGLTNLRRGYRTPDPSPTRGVADALPKCAATNCVVQARPRRSSSRTPSPLTTDKNKEARTSAKAAGTSTVPTSAQQRYRTPSPDCKYLGTDSRGSSEEHMEFPEVYCIPVVPLVAWAPGVFMPQVSGPSRQEDSMEHNVGITGECLDPPTPISGVDLAQDGEEQQEVEPPPSLGSIGHPHQCADACKYYWKARGCKDGADCNRCHLCTWRQIPYYRAHRRHLKGLQKARMDAGGEDSRD